MSWAKIDDQLHSNGKMMGCSLAARGLWLTCLSWVADKETDGEIPRSIVSLHGAGQSKRLAAELVAAGLWVEAEGGWTIHDYLTYNPSKSDIEAERQKAADRKAKWKERNANNPPLGTTAERRSSNVPNAERTLHPDPVPGEEAKASSPPTPTATENPQETTTTRVFAERDPLPVHVQNFLAQSCPPWWEPHLRLALAGRSPTGLANYALEILKGWKRGKNPPLAPLPEVQALPPPGDSLQRLPTLSELRARKEQAMQSGTQPGRDGTAELVATAAEGVFHATQ